MFDDEEQSPWRIAGIDFILDPDPSQAGAPHLRPQTPQRDILSRLVHVAYPEASRCALDMLFRHGFHCDFWDALEAYTERPLPDPPEEYREVCYAHNFASASPMQLSAIVLAGSQRPSDEDLLVGILEAASSDVRDGPLYAAASFRSGRIVDTVVRLAMREREDVLHGCGEYAIFHYIYKRWIRDGVVTKDGFYRLCKRHERDEGKAIQAERFMNYVLCPDWQDLLGPATSPNKRPEGVAGP